MKRKLMKCGHVANITTIIDGVEYEACGCCLFVTKDALIPVKENETPDLQNRRAKCTMCGKKTDSRWSLPFFEYRKDCQYDAYFCGCGGWD